MYYILKVKYNGIDRLFFPGEVFRLTQSGYMQCVNSGQYLDRFMYSEKHLIEIPRNDDKIIAKIKALYGI